MVMARTCLTSVSPSMNRFASRTQLPHFMASWKWTREGVRGPGSGVDMTILLAWYVYSPACSAVKSMGRPRTTGLR